MHLGPRMHAEAKAMSGSQYSFSSAAQTKLMAPHGMAKDFFGASVSLYGSMAVVGAPGSSPEMNDFSGSVLMFTNVTSNYSDYMVNRIAELYPEEPSPREEFGQSVSVFGRVIAVGAPNHDITGAVYVYMQTNGVWALYQRLTPINGDPGDQFGHSVSVGENYLIIGAPKHSFSRGAAYMYVRSSAQWRLKVVLQPSDLADHYEFGHCVAISDTFALVGAPGDSSLGVYGHGAVYLFQRTAVDSSSGGSSASSSSSSSSGSSSGTLCTWTQVEKLYPLEPQDIGQFGISVALSRHASFMDMNSVHTAVIGYQYDDSDYVANSGSVYVYYVRSGSVTFAERLEASDPNEDSQFGYSVAVHAGHIIVGTPGYTSSVGIDAGAAYMFTTDSYWKWYEAAKLWANDSAPYMRFGISVTLYEGYAVVGADQGEGVEQGTGAVYLFSEMLLEESRKKTASWHMPSNPENEYLFLLTVLPLAVLFIPILVLTCVWYCNKSNWGRIEEATAKALSKAQRNYKSTLSGGGGGSVEMSYHSTHGLIRGAEDVTTHSDVEVIIQISVYMLLLIVSSTHQRMNISMQSSGRGDAATVVESAERVNGSADKDDGGGGVKASISAELETVITIFNAAASDLSNSPLVSVHYYIIYYDFFNSLSLYIYTISWRSI